MIFFFSKIIRTAVILTFCLHKVVKKNVFSPQILISSGHRPELEATGKKLL